jgi:hypothetical protein
VSTANGKKIWFSCSTPALQAVTQAAKAVPSGLQAQTGLRPATFGGGASGNLVSIGLSSFLSGWPGWMRRPGFQSKIQFVSLQSDGDATSSMLRVEVPAGEKP